MKTLTTLTQQVAEMVDKKTPALPCDLRGPFKAKSCGPYFCVFGKEETISHITGLSEGHARFLAELLNKTYGLTVPN